MTSRVATSNAEKWATLRFAVVGPLLAAPPGLGELRAQLLALSERSWNHPVTGAPVRFAVPTIERWYYQARRADRPAEVLRRKPRADKDRARQISAALALVIAEQYRQHPSWNRKLHYDNLAVVLEAHPELGPLPSYSTLRRHLDRQGLMRQRRKRSGSDTKQVVRRGDREVRSYETPAVGGLWHLDFHHGSLRILDRRGEWVRPKVLAILDDRSRLICHAQWYLDEDTESLVHALSQAMLKRGLPRAILHDNGSIMRAAEVTEGLERLSILQRTTLVASPYQNGKQEVFFARLEARLMAMLEGAPALDLDLLNRATQAWIELEYHRSVHRETLQSPLDRYLEGPSVLRPAPAPGALVEAFTTRERRRQRQGDGTVSIEGKRFEVPAQFAHFRDLYVRFARWDLSQIWLADDHDHLVARLLPLDRAANATGHRRPTPKAAAVATSEPIATGGAPSVGAVAPLLNRLLAEYESTGLPPAYLPTNTTKEPRS